MKKMIFIAVLAGFNAVGSNAQNNTYLCTEKIVHKTPIAVQDELPTTGKYTYFAEDTQVKTITLVTPEVLVPASTQTESCYKYSDQNGLTVTKCPSSMYTSDNKNVYEYNEDGVYLGYYPVKKTTNIAELDDNMTCVKVDPTVTQSHVIYKWVVPGN